MVSQRRKVAKGFRVGVLGFPAASPSGRLLQTNYAGLPVREFLLSHSEPLCSPVKGFYQRSGNTFRKVSRARFRGVSRLSRLSPENSQFLFYPNSAPIQPQQILNSDSCKSIASWLQVSSKSIQFHFSRCTFEKLNLRIGLLHFQKTQF